MPRIFDNLTPGTRLLPALRETLDVASRADFCVGYFNLRGWCDLAPHIDRWGDDEGPCRVLIGMQPRPDEELREALRKTLDLPGDPSGIDNATAHRLHVELAGRMREQLTAGAPSAEDERTLRRLAAQLRARKVVVKLFLRHPLHAKLCLMGRGDPIVPLVGYVGSSNLTFSGLTGQGELNIDVLEQDAARKLQDWFNDRWEDAFCVDVTDELADIIDESWARETTTSSSSRRSACSPSSRCATSCQPTRPTATRRAKSSTAPCCAGCSPSPSRSSSRWRRCAYSGARSHRCTAASRRARAAGDRVRAVLREQRNERGEPRYVPDGAMCVVTISVETTRTMQTLPELRGAEHDSQ